MEAFLEHSQIRTVRNQLIQHFPTAAQVQSQSNKAIVNKIPYRPSTSFTFTEGKMEMKKWKSGMSEKLGKKASKGTWGCVQLSKFSLRKKKEISKYFDQISLNFTLINQKKEDYWCVYWYIYDFLWFFFFSSSTQSMPWENRCPGYPQLCPVLPAAPQAPEQWAPAPSAQTHHQLHFLSPNCLELPENFLWSKKDWNAHRGFPPLRLLWIYKTTQSVQFGEKKSLQWGHLVISCSHTRWILFHGASGNQIFLSLFRWLIGVSSERVWGEGEAWNGH